MKKAIDEGYRVFFYSSIQLHLLLRPYLCFDSFLNPDMYLLGDDTSKS